MILPDDLSDIKFFQQIAKELIGVQLIFGILVETFYTKVIQLPRTAIVFQRSEVLYPVAGIEVYDTALVVGDCFDFRVMDMTTDHIIILFEMPISATVCSKLLINFTALFTLFFILLESDNFPFLKIFCEMKLASLLI